MYCTHCGEKNPTGSTRCANCARPLASLPGPGAPVGRRCPMCGEVNAADAVFCAHCAARVVPLADVNEDEHELFTTGEDRPLDPDLARRITAPPEPPSRVLFGARSARSAGTPLSWLDALRGDTDQPAPAAGPTAHAAPDAAAPTREEPPLPAWLDAPAAPTREEPALPAWLDVPAAPTREEPALPAWLDASAAPTREKPALPAWLDASAPPAAAAEQPVLPAWLSGLSATPASPAPVAPAAPAPDAHRSGATPASPAPMPAAPAAPEVALPPWLRSAAPPPEVAPPAEPEAALPPRMGGRAEPPPASAAASVDGLPAWMSPPAEPSSPASMAASVDGLPAWMSPPAEPSSPASMAASVDGLPAWMSPRAVPPPQSPGASAHEVPAVPPMSASNILGDIELPAWLRAVAAAAPAPPPLRGRRPITGKLLPLDEELAAAHAAAAPVAPSGTAVPPASAAGPAPPPAQDEGLPAWLSGPVAVPEVPAAALNAAPAGAGGQAADSTASPAAGPAPAVPSGDAGLNAGDLPSWLRAIAAAPAPAAPPTPQPINATEEEIPAWLRALGSVEDELAPGAALGAASGSPLAVRRIIHARPPRAGAVAVFGRLLEPPPAPAVAPAARRSILSRLFSDRLVHLLLLATVVAMWVLAPQALDLSTATAPQTAEGGAFYDTLTHLPANAPVLLVYDWDATRYGEMHPLSVAVTRVLSATGHSLVTISTLPEGTGFALQVTAEVLPAARSVDCGRVTQPANPWPDAYGTRYLHLGYLPGNEAGLAQLATSNLAEVLPYDLICNYGLRRAPLLAKAPSVPQFGAIVLLAGGDLPLRLWIEQVASRVQVPVLAALPESLRTVAAPYLNLAGGNARLRAAVFGVAGAQETAQRLDDAAPAGAAGAAERATLGQVMHTESAALFFLALVLLIGFVSGIYRWINRRSAT